MVNLRELVNYTDAEATLISDSGVSPLHTTYEGLLQQIEEFPSTFGILNFLTFTDGQGRLSQIIIDANHVDYDQFVPLVKFCC